MSKVFFTSDTHFGHGNIIKYCARNEFLSEIDKLELDKQGGKWHDGDWKGDRASKWRISKESVETMDEAIISNLNKIVGKDDILWHLGDFCFGPKNHYYQVAKNYRDRIKCRTVNFVFGNHDHRNIRDLFNESYDLFETNINNQKVVLCHYAMAVWDKSHRGSWQLYGHSHSNLEEWMGKIMPGRRSIDVGIDNAKKVLGDYRPFSFEDLQRLIGNNTGFSSDHHGMRTGPTEEDLANK